MTVIALVLSIVLAMGSLAWGYVISGLSPLARWLALFGMAWLFSQWRRWWWFSSIGLIIAVVIAALGLWFEFVPGWMFSGAIFSLVAWDLTDFRRRMQFAAADDNRRDLESRHIARITLLAFMGLMLASLAMLTHLQFTFEWAALLVLMILLGLTQLVGWFKK